MHKGSEELAESDMHNYLDMMVNLLRAYESPTSKETGEAIDRILKVSYCSVIISNVQNTYKYLNQSMAGISVCGIFYLQ